MTGILGRSSFVAGPFLFSIAVEQLLSFVGLLSPSPSVFVLVPFSCTFVDEISSFSDATPTPTPNPTNGSDGGCDDDNDCDNDSNKDNSDGDPSFDDILGTITCTCKLFKQKEEEPLCSSCCWETTNNNCIRIHVCSSSG